MTTPFLHRILIKNKLGDIIQSIPVKENAAWEQFEVVYRAWADHPDFSPEPPTEKELYEKRKQ